MKNMHQTVAKLAKITYNQLRKTLERIVSKKSMVEVALYSIEVESRTALLNLVTKDKVKVSSSSNYTPQ